MTNDHDHEHHTHSEEEHRSNWERWSLFAKLRQIVFYILDITEVLLAFRFILKALNANALNPFVSFLYRVTEPLVAPFRNILEAPGTPPVIEWATIVAMIAYALLAYILIRLLRIVTTP